MAGIVVLIDPPRFDWNDRAVVEGHGWLLLAGFSWAIAILHARRHRWRTAPLDVLPWQMSVATRPALDPRPDPRARGLSRLQQGRPLDRAALYRLFAGPAGTWAAVSVARALPPVTGSLGMLGTPLLGIAASAVLVGEPITWPLLLGTALIIAGIAIVILDRRK